MNRLIPALLVSLVSINADTLADDSALKGDLAKLQGKWTAKGGPDMDIPIIITIKGNAVSCKVTLKDGTEVASNGEIKLDESAKPHKTIDWRKFTRPDGQEAPENLGIYSFEGDDFKICNGGPGNERPTEFKAGEGNGPPRVIILKREPVKASDAAADAPKGDLAKFQGSWMTKVGPNKDTPFVVVFKGNSVTLRMTVQGEEREFRGEFKLDEAAKPYKAIDWVKFTRPDGEVAPPTLGIYEFDGKDLKICSGGPNMERPTEFKGGEQGHPLLVTLKKDGGK